MTRYRSVVAATALVAALAAPSLAQEGYQPTPENLKARQWFQEARFGLFIHWGVYSVAGDGEWVMHQKRITVPEYERDFPPAFNPVKYDPAAWVAMAKAAGMKYITITSKHHDGFAMYDSKVSDYDVVERTPYGKDVLKMLADACRKEGIKLFFYHSQLDWHHPDYFPRGRTGPLRRPRREGRLRNRYLDYMDAQLSELLTGYGDDRRDLVRRLVGQARGRLAPRADLQAHPRPAARGPRRQQPPPQALPGRGLPDVREGPARATTPRASTSRSRSASCPSRCATRSTTRGATTRTTAATRARSRSCTCS